MSSPAVCRICHSGDNSLPYFGEALARSLISSCDLSASEWFIVYLIYYRFPATQQLCVHSTFSQIHVQVIVAAYSHQQTVNFAICTWAYFLLFSVFHGRSNNRTTFQRHYRNASSLLHALLVADEFHEMLWDLQARVQDRQVKCVFFYLFNWSYSYDLIIIAQADHHLHHVSMRLTYRRSLSFYWFPTFHWIFWLISYFFSLSK